MKLTEETVSSELLYRGRIIRLRNDHVLLPNGHEAQREFVEHPGGVCVLPLTQEGDVLLVNQFRYPYAQVLLELPAGKLDAGEEPLACGIRELREETGATAQTMTSLGVVYPSPGYTNEKLYLYLATGLSYGQDQPDEDEFLELVRMPLTQAVDKVLAGEIADAKTQIALLKVWAMAERGEVFK